MEPLLAALLAAALPAGITVEVTSPSDPCSLYARVPAALTRLLPGIRVTSGQRRAAPDQLHVALETGSPDAIEIRVIDAGGAPALVRNLPQPRGADACFATADAIGLIVERHLRDLGWVPPAEVPAAAPPPEPPPPPAPSPAPEPGPARTPTSAPPLSRPEPLHLDLSAVFSPELSSQRRVHLGGAIAARASWRNIAAALSIGLLLPATSYEVRAFLPRPDPAPGTVLGTIRTWSVQLLGGIGACAPLGGLRACGLLKGGPEWILGSLAVETNLFQRRTASVVKPLLAAEPRLELQLGELGALALGIDARWRPSDAPPFTVEDAETDYESPPRWSIAINLGGGLRVF